MFQQRFFIHVDTCSFTDHVFDYSLLRCCLSLLWIVWNHRLWCMPTQIDLCRENPCSSSEEWQFLSVSHSGWSFWRHFPIGQCLPMCPCWPWFQSGRQTDFVTFVMCRMLRQSWMLQNCVFLRPCWAAGGSKQSICRYAKILQAGKMYASANGYNPQRWDYMKFQWRLEEWMTDNADAMLEIAEIDSFSCIEW